MSRILFTFILCVLFHGAASAQGPKSDGDRLREQGRYLEAVECYKRGGMSLWQSIADCYRLAGDYNKAIEYNERILAMLPAGERRDRILTNLSHLWLRTGRYDQVVSALGGIRLGDGDDIRLANLSYAYMKTGRRQEALSLLDSVIEQTRGSMNRTYATALQNKGYILWDSGDYAAADGYLSAAFPQYHTDDRDRYVCEGNLALVKARLGLFDEALALIDNAIKWQSANLGGNHPDYAVSIRKKAEILLEADRSNEAVEWFRLYFDKERTYVVSQFMYMTENERLDLWNTHKHLIAECYATEEADPDFLLDVAVFSKSVLLQASTDFQKVFADDRLSELYASLKAIRTSLRNADSVQRDSLGREAESIERQLIRSAGDMHSYVSSLNTSGSDVRRAIASTADRAVEFIQYEKNDSVRYAALVTGKSAPTRFVPIFAQTEIEGSGRFKYLSKAVYSARGSDKNRIYADSLLGRAIWSEILRDVPQSADIYFSADGIFHLIGIEYLCFDRPDIRLHRVSSTRRLCDTDTAQTDDRMLLVGGLDYYDVSSVVEHRDTLPDRSGSDRLFKDNMPPATRGGYSYLPGSLSEVEAVGELWRGEVAKLTKGEGTEDAVKRELSRHGIICISTHGFCTNYESKPQLLYAKDSISEDLSLLRCGIVLSGANVCARNEQSNAGREDGILTAREICDADLRNAGLVVLSACQTGLGRITIDGVSGLSRGLKKAGAGSLLLSLWSVNDKATQLLMTEFYRNLAAGKNKYESLRTAQQYVREYEETKKISTTATSLQRKLNELHDVASSNTITVRPYAQPQYWAAFILTD